MRQFRSARAPRIPFFKALPTLATASLGILLAAPVLHAQDASDAQSARRGQFAGMQRIQGEVTAVNGANLTVKADDGSTYQIVTTDNTRVMKGRGNTIKVADIKVGDGAMAAGNLDAATKTLHAAMFFDVDAAQVKAMRDNLGKTYIAGKVTAIDIDNAKMTVERPDHVAQTIAFDETTSFKRGRLGRGGAGMFAPPGGGDQAMADTGESITLADVKVGDQIAGQGAVKSGTFTPTQLTVMTPGQGRRRGEGAAPSGTGSTPPAPPQ
ncbi:MAG: hypothetical protein V4555_04535 [Acidobacteriota bacterium]